MLLSGVWVLLSAGFPPLPTAQSSPVPWVGRWAEVGSFQSSLLGLLLVSQEKPAGPTKAGHITMGWETQPASQQTLQVARTPCSFVISPRSNVLRRRTATGCFRNLHAGKPKEICAPFLAMQVVFLHPRQPRCNDRRSQPGHAPVLGNLWFCVSRHEWWSRFTGICQHCAAMPSARPCSLLSVEETHQK